MIRRATIEDSDSIAETEAQSFKGPKTLQHIRRMIKSNTYNVFVAEEGGEVVGHIFARKEKIQEISTKGVTDKNTYIILGVAVREEFRRRGVGKSLMDSVKSKIPKGLFRITANVICERVPAQLFLKDSGFFCVRERKIIASDSEKHDAYEFVYRVPLDNLSNAHIAAVAAKAKASKAYDR